MNEKISYNKLVSQANKHNNTHQKKQLSAYPTPTTDYQRVSTKLSAIYPQFIRNLSAIYPQFIRKISAKYLHITGFSPKDGPFNERRRGRIIVRTGRIFVRRPLVFSDAPLFAVNATPNT